MIHHTLKSWPHLFEALHSGDKTHELRRCDDRAFDVGQVLLLREFDPVLEQYTGRELKLKITYITDKDRPCALSDEALVPTHCILSVVRIPD